MLRDSLRVKLLEVARSSFIQPPVKGSAPQIKPPRTPSPHRNNNIVDHMMNAEQPVPRDTILESRVLTDNPRHLFVDLAINVGGSLFAFHCRERAAPSHHTLIYC